MKYILSFALAVIITFLYSFFLVFDKMPESIQVQGYINYIAKSPSVFFGAFIGAFAASFFAFTPTIMKFPGYLLGARNRFTISSDPIRSAGTVIAKQLTQSHTNLTIRYNSHQQNFSVDNRVIPSPLSNGDEVVIYYDPDRPELAYIDFYQTNDAL